MSKSHIYSRHRPGVPLNFSFNDVQDIVRLRQTGMTVAVIAERKGVTREAIARVLAKHHQQQWTSGHVAAIPVKEPVGQRAVWRPSKTYMEQVQRALDYREYKSLVE